MEESRIVAVILNFGLLDGGNCVKIYFNMSDDFYMNFFLNEENKWFVRFGNNVVEPGGHPPKLSKVKDVGGVGDITHTGTRFSKKQILSIQNCQKVVDVIVPRGESLGLVDVIIGVHRRGAVISSIRLVNGYRYVDLETFKKLQTSLELQKKMENEKKSKEKDDDDEEEDEGEEEDDKTKIVGGIDEEKGIFNSPRHFFSIAQNRVSEVKDLIERKVIKIYQRDQMGFSAFDVAEYFKRAEIMDLLKEYAAEWAKVLVKLNEKNRSENSRTWRHIHHSFRLIIKNQEF